MKESLAQFRARIVHVALRPGRGNRAEDVSEVLVGYALRVYESPRTLQPDRVTS
jgi:hypothetical protein